MDDTTRIPRKIRRTLHTMCITTIENKVTWIDDEKRSLTVTEQSEMKWRRLTREGMAILCWKWMFDINLKSESASKMWKVRVIATARVVSFILLLLGRPVSTALDFLVRYLHDLLKFFLPSTSRSDISMVSLFFPCSYFPGLTMFFLFSYHWLLYKTRA